MLLHDNPGQIFKEKFTLGDLQSPLSGHPGGPYVDLGMI
jgi:hypothetical protein